MSDSLGEVRYALAGVTEQLGTAMQYAALARTRIVDAVTVLSGVGEQHNEPLVPAELHRAVEELERGLGLMTGGAEAVSHIEARL